MYDASVRDLQQVGTWAYRLGAWREVWVGTVEGGKGYTAESGDAGVTSLMQDGPQRGLLAFLSRRLLPGAGGASESCMGVSVEAGGGQADWALPAAWDGWGLCGPGTKGSR